MVKYIVLILSFVFLFNLESISFAQPSGPAVTRAGAVVNTRNVSSSTTWVQVAASFERGIVVNNPTGAASDICLARSTPECSTISDVTSCPIQITAGTSFEFLTSLDRYNGRVCVRRATGSGTISLGLSRW